MKIQLRKYQPQDCEKLAKLFHDTIFKVNAKDYTKHQLEIWANSGSDLEKWNLSLQKHYSLVAINNDIIVGFGDIDETGYLDRLYTHKDYQRMGIASAVCNKLEKQVKGKIFTHSSITAKPFFEKRGYKVVKKQEIKKEGVLFINFVMEKI